MPVCTTDVSQGGLGQKHFVSTAFWTHTSTSTAHWSRLSVTPSWHLGLSLALELGETRHIGHSASQQSECSVELCGLFNRTTGNECHYSNCRYTHICSICRLGPHPAARCTKPCRTLLSSPPSYSFYPALPPLVVQIDSSQTLAIAPADIGRGQQ